MDSPSPGALSVAKSVTHAADRLDAVRAKFSAQEADIGFDDVATGLVVVAPDVAQYLLS